jgi:hypothetical protein
VFGRVHLLLGSRAREYQKRLVGVERTLGVGVESERSLGLGASADVALFAYRAFSAVLRLLARSRQTEFAKDVELLVLRHQQPVLTRQHESRGNGRSGEAWRPQGRGIFVESLAESSLGLLSVRVLALTA